MSKFLTQAAVIEFDSDVKHEFQGNAGLRSAVTLRTGVVGESYKFARMGKGMANQKASQADVTPMDVDHLSAGRVTLRGRYLPGSLHAHQKGRGASNVPHHRFGCS